MMDMENLLILFLPLTSCLSSQSIKKEESLETSNVKVVHVVHNFKVRKHKSTNFIFNLGQSLNHLQREIPSEWCFLFLFYIFFT